MTLNSGLIFVIVNWKTYKVYVPISQMIEHLQGGRLRMLKIAVLDDRKELTIMACKLIEENVKGNKIIKSYTDPKLLQYDVDEGNRYDVYILDIEMPKISGLTLATKIRKVQFDSKIIFLTSHPEYAINGYHKDIQAYQYILKNTMNRQLPEVLNDLQDEMKQQQFYIIQNKVCFEKINCEKIVYIYKDGKNAVIKHISGEYKERKTLEEIEKNIHMKELISINRGCLVNIQHIRSIKNNLVTVDTGENLYISRAKISKVKQQVNEYWSNVL